MASFFIAVFLAYAVRGNVLSSLMGTFFGNPITFPIIGVVSYRSGLYILGMGPEETAWDTIRSGISEAFISMWSGVQFLFGYGPTRWDGFVDFFHSVFIPYFKIIILA